MSAQLQFCSNCSFPMIAIIQQKIPFFIIDITKICYLHWLIHDCLHFKKCTIGDIKTEGDVDALHSIRQWGGTAGLDRNVKRLKSVQYFPPLVALCPPIASSLSACLKLSPLAPHQHDIPPHFLDGPAVLLSNCHFLVLDLCRRRTPNPTAVHPSNPQPCLNSGSSSQPI